MRERSSRDMHEQNLQFRQPYAHVEESVEALSGCA